MSTNRYRAITPDGRRQGSVVLSSSFNGLKSYDQQTREPGGKPGRLIRQNFVNSHARPMPMRQMACADVKASKPPDERVPPHDFGELILAVSAGDKLAFRRLYDLTSPLLLGMLIRKLRRRELAEDALQECFIKIWQKAGTFDSARGSAMAWLITLARNQGTDILRAQAPEETGLDLEALIDEWDEESTDPERDAETAIQLRRIGGPLAALAPSVRASVLLTCYEGYTHMESAKLLNAPLGTIKSWVRRGLEQLRVQSTLACATEIG